MQIDTKWAELDRGWNKIDQANSTATQQPTLSGMLSRWGSRYGKQVEDRYGK